MLTLLKARASTGLLQTVTTADHHQEAQTGLSRRPQTSAVVIIILQVALDARLVWHTSRRPCNIACR